MKKFFNILAMMLVPISLFGQSYSSLWKKVSEAQSKDLPKTQHELLGQIVRKAEAEAQYGQLLKAQLMQSSVSTQISPDSSNVELARLEQKAQSLKDPVLKAVYASVLGNLYKMKPNSEAKSREWFALSLADPQLLARNESRSFEPAILNGIDSKIFYNDLLHVLGFEAGNFTTLREFYTQRGNRAAACIAAGYEIIAKRESGECECKKSKYLQIVDSLINEYSDIREAGELAIERYHFMARSSDATAEDRVNYINYALNRWGSWPRMNILRNALSDLQRPMFNINIGQMMLLPQSKRLLRVNNIRNISELYVNVYRLNVNGDTDLDPKNKEDYAQLQKLIFPGTVQGITRRYIGQPAWKENTDSIMLEGMPIGVYLIEATTDNKDIAPQRELLRVSDIFVMSESHPDNQTRFVVVNATTGKPVSGAHITLTPQSLYDNEKPVIEQLTTNKNGEAYWQKSKQRVGIYAYTDNDRAGGKIYQWGQYNNWERPSVNHLVRVYTDRSIYRPGQQVHAAAIAWSTNIDNQTSQAGADTEISFKIFDANNKKIGEQTVRTDRMGTASANFTLPQGGLTGDYRLVVQDNHTSYNTYFHVEQYKRPTFQVEFEPYKETYHAGDTVIVRGMAKSYAGQPVQGAKVEYTVDRRLSRWFFHDRSISPGQVITDSTVTSDDGSFMVKMPMVYPDNQDLDRPIIYNMVANAKVTDISGETHEAQTSLPLSNRSSFLSSNLPTKQLRDSLKTLTFTRQNVSGEEIEGIVRYRFDGGPWKIAAANKSITLDQKFSSGKHVLESICEDDSLTQTVILFSYADKKPVVETHDWFHVSGDRFPADGKPIYLQVGTSDEDTHVYYSIFSGNKVLAKGSKVLSNEVHTEKISYKPSFGDGILINMAWVRNGALYTHTVRLQRPTPDNHLRLSWKTFRDKLTPGQKEEWTLNMLSPDGKPAKAQLLAVLYDKSLDAIHAHNWTLNNVYPNQIPYTFWQSGYYQALGLYGFYDFKALPEKELDFSHWDTDMFGWSFDRLFYMRSRSDLQLARSVKIRGTQAIGTYDGVPAIAEAASLQGVIGSSESKKTGNTLHEIVPKVADSASDETNQKSQSSPIQVRENLNETAFFYPALTTDTQGNVSIRFTLPESVTTWRFLGVAHDEQINIGQIAAEAVAKKTVMVQPNLPRFIRMGDKARLNTRIANTSERRVSGTARLQLLDPETETVISEWTKPFSVESNRSENISFDVDGDRLAAASKGNDLFIARVIAEGRGFSDGEQHYLPLLPNREYVTTTVPFTQNGAGTKSIDLSRLFPLSDTNNKLTVEYTNRPAWLMVQALPTVANPYDKNAISLATAIYANTIGQHLLQSSPKIGQTIKLWQQETGKETSLMSSLQKNEDLKTLVLSETPWVANAESETAQKQQLINFLDESTIGYRLSTFTQKLADLQNPDGSFSWWPGMSGSTFMTTAVVKILTRLNAMTGTQNAYDEMLDRAFAYLDRRMAEEVTELKKMEKKDAKHLTPSDNACNYLYANALAKRPSTPDVNYLVGLLDKMPTALTIYGKAGAAIILAQYGKIQHAKDYLRSIDEYSVYSEEMGRYFDTKVAHYSCFDYKIPSQVAAIEALKALTPADTKTVEDMQRWLLHEKRTTGWDTPLNAVDAIYAFLADNSGKADMSKLSGSASTVLSVDGKTIDTPQATAGLGYVKATLPSAQAKTFTATKTDQGTSWGAIYAQYRQKATDVTDAASGIQVKREILHSRDLTPVTTLKVGDKVVVRITITASRDYDFVQVQDKRAACMEPAGQLSGYRGGYYSAPQDNVTNYYFDRLAKGKHIIETGYYVDREGEYATGICTVQCAYSPEFSGREAAKTIRVSR